MNHQHPTKRGAPHGLGGCAICALTFWVEDLYELDLFTAPSHIAAYSADGFREQDAFLGRPTAAAITRTGAREGRGVTQSTLRAQRRSISSWTSVATSGVGPKYLCMSCTPPASSTRMCPSGAGS